MKIKKRNGDIVPYDREKVINAINKALIEVDGALYETDTAEDIASEIEEIVNEKFAITEKAYCEQDYTKKLFKVVTVEEIQDYVEDTLMRSERRDVAKAYIRYRYKRELAREYKDELMEVFSEKLEAKSVKNQNANVDEYSFGGRKGEASSVMDKQYALEYCISPMAKKNHLENMIYIHDLDSYAVGMHNCLSIPFDDLLANGFNTRQTDVRPAGSVSTAMQLVAVIFQLQSLQQFGGVSATHLDWTMVPYVRKSFYKHYKKGLKYLHTSDKQIGLSDLNPDLSINDEKYKWYGNVYEYAMEMLEGEVYQAVEGLYHNLNTLQSRSGNQLPFTSINYGTCILPEGRMITKALLEVLIKGLGSKKKTSVFPCGIFQSAAAINRYPGTPNYDLYRLALRATAQRL